MDYYIFGHNYINEIQTTLQIFFPNRKYKKTDNISESSVSSVLENDIITSAYYENGEKILEKKSVIDKYNKYNEYNKSGNLSMEIRKNLYLLLSGLTGYKSAWGILTGIRPTKIIGILKNEGLSPKEIHDYMSENYLLRDDKINLISEVYEREESIIKGNNGFDKSLYIGIPFCPTRCLYCSFTSYPIDKYRNFVSEYLDCLEKEMSAIAKILKSPNYLETIYIGGGTPTSLDEENLERLLYITEKYFDTENLKEYTVEAGRPDTLNREKLRLMKKFKVSRISINPQTMNDKTLRLIGRQHTAEEFTNVFYLARDEGFHDINVDLILGLPEETEKDVINTFEKIKKLKPESLTVHTLSVKRSSALKEKLSEFNFSDTENLERSLKISGEYARSMNLLPYYMYRQKNMLGNFENIGYSKKNHEGIYNVQMMEEKQTVFAIGAGAASKIYYPKENRLERIFNVKNIDEYLRRIDEMLERKKFMEV